MWRMTQVEVVVVEVHCLRKHAINDNVFTLDLSRDEIENMWRLTSQVTRVQDWRFFLLYYTQIKHKINLIFKDQMRNDDKINKTLTDW